MNNPDSHLGYEESPIVYKTWTLYWAPEGKPIGEVQARTEQGARRQAPMPYRKFMGEIYAVEV